MTFGAGKNHSLHEATQRYYCAVNYGTQVIGTDFESNEARLGDLSQNNQILRFLILVKEKKKYW